MSELKTTPPLHLASIKSTRRSIARLVKERHEGRITDDDFRALMFGLQTLVGAFKAEHEITVAADLERRIETLEDQTGENRKL